MSKIFLASGVASLVVALGMGVYLADLPDVSILKLKNPQVTSMMKIRETQMRLKRRRFQQRRRWVPYESISPYLRYAVVVAEDGSFFEHKGLDMVQIKEALRRDWEKRSLAYGGSTITQQLAKNLYLTPSKNPLRKIKEALIARRLEKELGKRRILELYLNVVEWGSGIYGAEEASRQYFNKPASDLTSEESARLAAYLPSPIRLARPRNAKYIDKMTARILRRMQARGFLPVS
ncbi:MAG: monofunctional biosynthetic peptidoglycan transglycosylase [Elusimicrobiota bacterium]